MKVGFTLLETLAATVMLGLLAVTMVPLVMQLSRGDAQAAQRWQLIHLVETSEPATWPSTIHQWEVSGHPGYWWRVVALQSGVTPSRSLLPNERRMGHRWYQIAITHGNGPEASVIADRLVLIPVGVVLEP